MASRISEPSAFHLAIKSVVQVCVLTFQEAGRRTRKARRILYGECFHSYSCFSMAMQSLLESSFQYCPSHARSLYRAQALPLAALLQRVRSSHHEQTAPCTPEAV